MKIKTFLLELSILLYAAAQSGYMEIHLDQMASATLKQDQWIYFSYKIEHDRIGNSILSVRIKGTEQFSDPDVVLSLKENPQFDRMKAEYRCFQWGQDVCSIPAHALDSITILYGAVYCQYDCTFEMTMALAETIECNNPFEDPSQADPRQSRLSTQCTHYFESSSGNDEAFITFTIPDRSDISRATFIVTNDENMEGVVPKLNMWVNEGNNKPESNNTAMRGYSLFEESIGYTIERPRGGTNYTILIEEFQQQDQPFSARAKIQMLIELKNEVIDLGHLTTHNYLKTMKRGIVGSGDYNCYSYNVADANSQFRIALKTHSGFTRLIIGKGENPDFRNNNFIKDAYYVSQGEPFSFIDIEPDEREGAQSGYSYICVQGITKSSYSILACEEPGRPIKLASPYIAEEFEVIDKTSILFVTEPQTADAKIEFLMRPSGPGKLSLYVKECELLKDPFPLMQYQNRTIVDTSIYSNCIPTAKQIENLKHVQKADSINRFGLERIVATQRCKGQTVFVKDTSVRLSPCAFMIHVVNHKETSQRFVFESKEAVDKYFYPLQEHTTLTDSLSNKQNKTYWISVADQSANRMVVEVDAIHGFVQLYLKKWEVPGALSYDYRASRMGRVPDVISFTELDYRNRHPNEKGENVLIGDFFLTVQAYSDAIYNVGFTIKREDSESDVMQIEADKPYTKSLPSAGDYALFFFSGRKNRKQGDDYKIQVTNINSNTLLNIYVEPFSKSSLPPSRSDDYMFESTSASAFTLSSSNPDIDLNDSFYIRVERPKGEINTQEVLTFRITVLRSGSELALRNGELEQGIISPNSSSSGVHFKYSAYNFNDEILVSLTEELGGEVQMFISVGVPFPGQSTANLGKHRSIAEITPQNITEASAQCADSLKKPHNPNSYLEGCTLHITVLPLQNRISSAIFFGLKVMQKSYLSLLVNGKTEVGSLIGNPEASALYYFRIWQLPEEALYLTVTPWRKGSSGVKILANIRVQQYRLSYEEIMSSIPTTSHHNYNSTEYHNTQNLRLSKDQLQRFKCRDHVCLLLVKVIGEEYTNFNILASSSIARLREDDQVYDSVKHNEYVYFEFYNPCPTCPLSIFIDVLSPTMGSIELFINYSLKRKDLKLPTSSDAHFVESETELLSIDPENKKEAGLSENMEGFYLIGVYGYYGDNTQFSLRVTTKTQKVDIMKEGMLEHVQKAPAGTLTHFLYKNKAGNQHVNLKATPVLGDVEIWVKEEDSDILEDAYNSFPASVKQADYTSASPNQQRNSLQMSNICQECYLLIVVKNLVATDYDIILTTQNHDNPGTDLIKKFLPFSSIGQGKCSAHRREMWYIAIDGTHRDDMELRIVSTVGLTQIYVDIGKSPEGNQIENDFAGIYYFLEAEKLNEGEDDSARKNIFFTIFCATTVLYNIEVRALDPQATMPTPIVNNAPVTGFFTSSSTELFYSYQVFNQNSTIFVNLSKPRKCSLNFYAAIQDAGRKPIKPDDKTSKFKQKVVKNGEYLTLQIPKPDSISAKDVEYVFGVYYNKTEELPTGTTFCPFSIAIDTLEVTVIQEKVSYLGRMVSMEESSSQQTTLRQYMNIYEIHIPRLNEQLIVELKPCSDTFIEFCVSSKYIEGSLDISDCDGKSEGLSGGKKIAIFKAIDPVYFIYVYRGKQKYQTDAQFFVRAYYQTQRDNNGIVVAKDDGKLTIHMTPAFGSSLPKETLQWGTLMRDRGPQKLEELKGVSYHIYMAQGQNKLRTECQIYEGTYKGTVQDQYQFQLELADNLKESGVSFNVLAITADEELVLYNEEYVQMNSSRARFWIILVLVLALLSCLGITLAFVFRRKLKKKQQELEFQMTDIRNVARVPGPAQPYYEVTEVEERGQDELNKSGDFKELQP